MSRCKNGLILLRRSHKVFLFHCRDYLLQFSSSETKNKIRAIGKNDEKTPEKSEKKEKKIKEMSASRVKKFRKLFGQQIPAEETLINYFSCAIVAEILLQGHLYVSENYFSFYSNVFGYITKIVFPVGTVISITKEKTAKFFPNAIALQLSDGTRHIFGSFLSREEAYQLMQMIHRKTEASIEAPDVFEAVSDEVDEANVQEVSSIDDTSSVSGSESSAQIKITSVQGESDAVQVPVVDINLPVPTSKYTETSPEISQGEHVGSVGKYDVKLMSEYNVLFVGICLTILLAFFSAFLLMKINGIEQSSLPSDNILDFSSHKLSIDDAEKILNRNVLIVRNVRKKLEDLHEMLSSSFNQIPAAMNDKQEL
ncbi:CLUMA_CG002406, isoform A [Clunio marinus]|uniref:CLUMA_CG002406, isoform A n=1 Tax=Clunio marinus TaxID=568069 RepID=A0A1J1HKS0_9DIPT|nr:CLUMA_CG002406, isoform A [Clunio marinus]